MDPNEIFPPESIAFYNEHDSFKYQYQTIANKTPNSNDNIDIYEYGPWQYPTTKDPTVCARYVIGHSAQGYHWDTEFVFAKDKPNIEYGIQKSCIRNAPKYLSWSPACAFADHAIKHARRCITIQAENISLDTKTKIRIILEDGEEIFISIDEIQLDKRLIYQVERSDLQRIALFNGYLSWGEYENGAMDFNLDGQVPC